jgi:hypothetical protein
MSITFSEVSGILSEAVKANSRDSEVSLNTLYAISEEFKLILSREGYTCQVTTDCLHQLRMQVSELEFCLLANTTILELKYLKSNTLSVADKCTYTISSILIVTIELYVSTNLQYNQIFIY